MLVTGSCDDNNNTCGEEVGIHFNLASSDSMNGYHPILYHIKIEGNSQSIGGELDGC